jgi:hypothetical protein
MSRLMEEPDLSHATIKSAVTAIHSGKHTPSDVAVMRRANKFLESNKSHPYHKSDSLRKAIGRVIPGRKPIKEASVDYYTPAFKKTVGEIEKKASFARGAEGIRDLVFSSTPKHKRALVLYTKKSTRSKKAEVDGPYALGDLPLNRASLWHMTLPPTKKPKNKYDYVDVGSRRHTIAHELAHTHDPSAQVPGGPWDNPVPDTLKRKAPKKPRKKRGYLSNTPFYDNQAWSADPLEVHANAVSTVAGMEGTKAAGLSRDSVLHDLRTGYKQAGSDLFTLVNQKNNIARNPNKVRDLTNLGLYEPVVFKGQRYTKLLHSKSRKSRTSLKLRQHSAKKLFKETNKAIEKVYGSRNTTGGTVNKFGQVKLARPISKLPEELQEKYDDNTLKIDRYGRVHVFQLDRGKPGDYAFWEKHKDQAPPVTRPPDPPKPKLHRAEFDQPKSTARDRVLAHRKKLREEFDLSTRKRTKYDEVYDRLRPLIATGYKNEPYYKGQPIDVAKEIADNPNEPHHELGKRLYASMAARLAKKTTVAEINKKNLMRRVRDLDKKL